MKIEICILAGGLSARMGKDKSRLRLGRKTMLGMIRQTARKTGLRVRTIRRDLVARCGPLGGIYTGLKSARAANVIFLACDMPFVRREMLEELASAAADAEGEAVFFRLGRQVTFPFLIPRTCLEKIEILIQEGDRSVQSLRHNITSKTVRPSAKWLRCFANINTPEDLRRARGR